MKRWKYVMLFAFLAIIAFIVYMQIRIPPGVSPMGANDHTTEKLVLWSAIASAIAAFFSFLKEAIGLFKSENRHDKSNEVKKHNH